MLSRGQWMLIFDITPNIVQDCILNEKNDGATFFQALLIGFSAPFMNYP